MENLDKLVIELCKQPNETEWLEYKSNNYDPDMIGKDISALANSAEYWDRDFAYMVWGVSDCGHEIIGTEYNQYTKKIGNQEIGSWLRNNLSKNAEFEFNNIEIEGKQIVVLSIRHAQIQPVTFKKDAYIRIGSYTKRINEYPSIEAKLWDKLRARKYEEQIAMDCIEIDQISQFLNISIYFDLLHITSPSDSTGMIHYLMEDKIVQKRDDGLYSITNLGALLFARRLSDFPNLQRKALRIISYDDETKYAIKKQHEISSGYAVGFESIINYLDALLPSEEVITPSVRETKTVFPSIALREIIANAIIHQDLSINGTSPMIEVFPKRIEVTNPGRPIIDINRFVDNPPRSRNELLSALMRRLGFCEEAGSGWDRILIECEINRLPAPLVELYEENTKVTLFSSIPFSNLKAYDKVWSCYMHACIKYVTSHEGITNSSLRERFGLNDTMSAQISRLFKIVLREQLIKPFDAEADFRHQKYVPYWA